jgi:hypothetical protein
MSKVPNESNLSESQKARLAKKREEALLASGKTNATN